jgi:hypothetical protein
MVTMGQAHALAPSLHFARWPWLGRAANRRSTRMRACGARFTPPVQRRLQRCCGDRTSRHAERQRGVSTAPKRLNRRQCATHSASVAPARNAGYDRGDAARRRIKFDDHGGKYGVHDGVRQFNPDPHYRTTGQFLAIWPLPSRTNSATTKAEPAA